MEIHDDARCAQSRPRSSKGRCSPYRAAELCYRAVIAGAPEHASAAQLREHTSRLTAFFAIEPDQISDSGEAALQRGFRRIQADYDQELRRLLSAMGASYDAMIAEFERVATPAEQASVDALRAAQRQHRVAEEIALASDRPAPERREQGISAARALFDASVCRQLNDTLAELQQAIDNHNDYRMVAVSAGRLARKQRDLDKLRQLAFAESPSNFVYFDTVRSLDRTVYLDRPSMEAAIRAANRELARAA